MYTLKLLLHSCMTSILLFSFYTVHAEDFSGKSRDRDKLRNHLWEILKDAEQVETARTNGKELTQFCTVCHGKNGISKNQWEPNLAGQDATYLLDQLINFATKKRRNLVMNDLTSKLADGELIDITIYYSSMKNTYIPKSVDPQLMVKGKDIYMKTCTGCHGVKGKGIKGFANLSGQKAEYIVSNLTKFKGDSRRSSSTMGPIVDKLSSADIKALAQYITSMNLAATSP